MKTSNYILITFLIFILIAMVTWHLDSSLHEVEYDRKNEIEKAFYSSRAMLEKDRNSLEKRNDFADKAKIYFEYSERDYYDYRQAAELLSTNFITVKDTSNLVLAKQWAKKAHEIKPESYQINLLNYIISESLGYKEEAKKYFDIIKKLDSIKGYLHVEYRNDKGEIIRVKKSVN